MLRAIIGPWGEGCRSRSGGLGGLIRFRPMTGALRRLGRRATPDLGALARERWEAFPGNLHRVPPAIHLPGQIERIRGTEFNTLEHTIRVLRGDFDAWQEPTWGYRVTDVDLVDGTLFGRGAERRLRPPSRRAPAYRAPREALRGALYESWIGNRWFGSWLSEDCLTYRLAEAAGRPVTTAPEGELHGPVYEALLGMAPRRVEAAHFDEVILFDDLPNNEGKAARARDMRDRLLAGRDLAPVPGVFLLRGQSGARRLLANEREIADRFATEYGFAVVDPMASSVDAITAACGQARVVAGVEGSHLVHGTVMMPQDAVLFVIQPPERALVILKSLTDRQGQVFAFVVAEGGMDGFTADWTEIRRTLDLALEARHGARRTG
jgi:hypothetical protein